MRMRKRVSVAFVVAAACCVALTVSSALAKEFIANTFFPDKHPLAKYCYIEWAKDLEKASGGKLKAKVFTGTVLLEPRANLSGVRDGVAQVAYQAAMYTPADLPLANALQETGFAYSDPLVAMVAVTEFSMTNPQQLAEWKKAGIVYGGGYCTPGYCLMCTQPVRDMNEVKGKKLRTSGAANSRWAESVGAVPVNVPSSEMYTGLEKRSIDCATNVVSDLKDRSLWDVAKHTTLISLGMYWGGPKWGWNRDYWNSKLTAEERRIIFDVTAQAMANVYVGYQKAIDEALNQSAEHKVNIYEPGADLLQSLDRFNEANRSEVIKMVREKYKIENPEPLLAEFAALNKKWQERFAQIDRKDAMAIGKIIKEELYDKIDAATYGR